MLAYSAAQVATVTGRSMKDVLAAFRAGCMPGGFRRTEDDGRSCWYLPARGIYGVRFRRGRALRFVGPATVDLALDALAVFPMAVTKRARVSCLRCARRFRSADVACNRICDRCHEETRKVR